MNITTAVLITSHNRREKTIACLKFLYYCDLPKSHVLEVFLVDDGSTDGTGDAVKDGFPMANLIHGTGDLFWNRGMHIAWETASKTKDYDYYLWLNDDTLLFENSLKLMLEYIQTLNNRQIIVGATCSSKTGIVTYSGFNFPDKKLNPNNTWQNCDFFNGNIVLIPSFVFHQVGIIDKRFRHTLGDFDYGMRASKLGFVHVLSPNFLGNCEEHETDPVWRNLSFPLYKRLRNLYTPLGNNPIEYFVFDRRHNGFLIALLHFLTIHLRSIFPSIWKK